MKLKDLLTVTFGTFVLIVLGDGVVANVGWLHACRNVLQLEYDSHRMAVAVYVSIWVSGGDHNPASLSPAQSGVPRPGTGPLPLSSARLSELSLRRRCPTWSYRDGLVRDRDAERSGAPALVRSLARPPGQRQFSIDRHLFLITASMAESLAC